MRYKPIVFTIDLIPLYEDEPKQSPEVEYNLIRESLINNGFPVGPMKLANYVSDFNKLYVRVTDSINALTLGIPADITSTKLIKVDDHKYTLLLK